MERELERREQPSEEQRPLLTRINRRFNILFFVAFLFFAALVLRLAIVQLVHGEQYAREAEANSMKRIPITAPRGWIVDRNGEVLVNNEPVYTVTFLESEGQRIDYDEVADRLARLLDSDVDDPAKVPLSEVKERLSKMEKYRDQPLPTDEAALRHLLEKETILEAMRSGYRFMPHRIKEGLSVEEVARVSENLDRLPGVRLVVESKRNYKRGAFLTHVLGYTKPIDAKNKEYYLARGYQIDDKVGTSGLEAYYETQLHGQDGVMEVKVDKNGRTVEMREVAPPKRGHDLVLTIDARFQDAVERILEEEVKRLRKKGADKADKAIAIAMNPNTGEILAMATYPDYDLNLYNLSGKEFSEAWKTHIKGRERNEAVYGTFSPGSTIKPATVLLGLQKGLVSPNETVYCRGVMMIGNRAFRDFQSRAHGAVNARTALQKSCNTYMYEMALRLARTQTHYKDAFPEMDTFYAQFGLGVRTGIDLPGENMGWRSTYTELGNLAHYAIGQYHAYTPIQLLQYVSTIANGGYRMRPYLVKEIRGESEQTEGLGPVLMARKPEVLGRVEVDPQYLQVVREGMRLATQKGGTAAGAFAGFPVPVGVKTGTVQVDTKRGIDNALMIGFAPFDKPEIAFVVIVTDVPKGYTGGSAAGPIARRMLEAYFNLGAPATPSSPGESAAPAAAGEENASAMPKR
ncbi:penicillin-binding protein 2 [Calditerricola yamamurae]